LTSTAVFLSSPRFDQDFISDIKLVEIDATRFLCVLVTDFGVIKTETLRTEKKLSQATLHQMEKYFHWRLRGQEKPVSLTKDEETLAQEFYNEVMVRYIIGYSNFSDEEIYRTGFSELLRYPDFNDVTSLANSLALFENPQSMRMLLRECVKSNHLKFWIGDDLFPYMTTEANCSILAIPYRIGQKAVGAFALLGPLRIPYRQLFGILTLLADNVSEALTRNLYKYKSSSHRTNRTKTSQQQASLARRSECGGR
jgi:heat-inducible transcriptional repressor